MKARFLWLVVAVCLLVCSRGAAQQGTCRAVLIGCDAFLTQENTAPSAALNVERMARVLQTDRRGYDQVLCQAQGIGSAQALQALLEKGFAEASPADTSLLYICTHGLYDRVSYESLLVLSDGTSEESVSAVQLREMLEAFPGRKILLLDACNSGAFIGKGVRGEETQNAFAGDDFYVLTSAGGYENSFLWRNRGSAGGSYFAQELCEGLKNHTFDLDADGTVTLDEAYHGMLEFHGVSTVQRYPQRRDTVLYAYDAAQKIDSERPISDILLENAILTTADDTVYFSYTVHRPVRVQYQLVYYRNGQWRFDMPQIVEDVENREGALLPGRKERSVTLVSEDETPYGYVLLMIVAQEGRYAMLAGSRLLSVQPDTGNPRLSAWCDRQFSPAEGEEARIYVRHAFPCSLGVRILSEKGDAVCRLSYKAASRPTGQRQDGSFFFWDGTDAQGQPAAPGKYVAEITCNVGGESYRVQSAEITLEPSE